MGYHVAEFGAIEDLWRFWAAGYLEAKPVRPLVVQQKFDGLRLCLHRKGTKTAIWTEDKKRERSKAFPRVVKELLALPVESVILDTEFVLWEAGAPVPRREMVGFVVRKEPYIEEDVRVNIHDILYLDGEPLIDKPYIERLRLLKKILPEDKKHLRKAPYKIVKTKAELKAAIEWASTRPGSEGAMIKSADSKYSLKGEPPRTIDWAKFKIIQEIKVQVIGILKKPLPWRSIKKEPPKEPLIGDEAIKWYKRLAEKSETFLFRVAIRKDKKLVPLSAEAPLTPAELTLRWVVPGKPDPLTGKMVTGERGDWRGTNDPRIWKMGLGFKDRERGEPAYAVTYAIKLPGAKIGSIITVNPVLMRKWKDKAGKTHYSWTFPIVRDLDPTRELPDTVEDAERIVRATAKKRKIKEALRPPWSHPRGKFSLAPQIAALIPKHKRYVEPMCGACHVLFYKEPSEEEIINDSDKGLIRVWRAVKKLTDADIESLWAADWRPDRQRWLKLRKQRPQKPRDIVFRWMYLKRFAYASAIERGFSPRFRVFYKKHRPDGQLRRLRAARERLKNVKITCEDVLKSIKRWDSRETFFYLDPPHLGLAGRVESFGQRKLIPITRLASALRGILGKFILSVPDTPEMRRDFAEFHKVSVETRRLVRPFSGARRRELLIANFPLKSTKREGLAERQKRLERPDEAELPKKRKPTREEMRKAAEKMIGDWYMVKQPEGVYFPSALQRHIRGIYTPDQLKVLRRELRRAKTQADINQIFKEWKDLRLLTAPFEKISRIAQEVDDERGDVTAAIKKFLSKEPPRIGRLETSLPKLVNLGSVHTDWRCPHPSMEYLSNSWTCDMPKVVLQRIADGKLLYPLRDRILENKEGDQWLNQKKCKGAICNDEEELLRVVLKAAPEILFEIFNTLGGADFLESAFDATGLLEAVLDNETLLAAIQPMVWLRVVTRERPTLYVEPGEIGATVATAGLFIWAAEAKLVYGVQKTDYHEYFFFFEAFNERIAHKKAKDLDGRWDWRLIPGRPEYKKAPLEAFWLGARPWVTQTPYILTHDYEEELKKAKKEKIEMIWNPETIITLAGLTYPHLMPKW